MPASVTRLTLYALISAIELDLRSTLSTFLPQDKGNISTLGADLFAKLAERCESETSIEGTQCRLDELLQFADYGDVIQLARTHKASLPEDLNAQLASYSDQFTLLIGTRNRVMHARPLEFDDLAKTTDLCEALLRNARAWTNLLETRSRLTAEPDRVLRLSIPFEADNSTISHNLPLPDFDETGFIGRQTTIKNLRRAIDGIYPVITIVGEGGLGKTSLALKVAYDLLDQPDKKFDAIVFVSAKTQKLTENEIERIRGAINTSVGLIEAATKELGGGSAIASNPMDDLIELMDQFNVLLVIDNLETVLDDNINTLMERLPAGSKILITTRIRIGAFEFPIQLEPLSEVEATKLLRATARVRECNRLVAMSDKKLQDYCKKMRNSPLHIKWFVSAVQSGQRPEVVLADEKLFLQFCLSNVFNVISTDGRKLVRTLLSLGGSYTVAELSFLTSMDQTTLLKAIGELTRTNMFFSVSTPTDTSFETKYELSQLARAYLSRFYPVNKEEQQRLLLHKKKLVSAGEQIASEAELNPFSTSSIHCRTRSDWVVAKYLKDAIGRIKDDKIDDALNLLREAKSLAPDFFEVYRVEAFAHTRAGDITSAYDSYERAIEFAPESAFLRMLFGTFLLREVHDTESAIDQFRMAMQLQPDRLEPKIEFARSSLYLRHFDDAAAVVDELDKIVIKSDRLRTIVTDLHLQLLTRSADHFEASRQPQKAVERLKEAQAFFRQIDGPDQKMQERVSKLKLTVTRLRSQLSAYAKDPSELDALDAWINEVSNQSKVVESHQQTSDLGLSNTGFVKFIHKSGTFGFVTQPTGDDLFFHKNYLKMKIEDLRAGQPVTFTVGIDWRGRIVARDVQPAI